MNSQPLQLPHYRHQALRTGQQTQILLPLTPQPPGERQSEGYSFHLGPAVHKSIGMYSLNHYDTLPKQPGVFDVAGAVGFVRDHCGQTEWECPLGIPGSRLYIQEPYTITPDHPEGYKAIPCVQADGTTEHIIHYNDHKNRPAPDGCDWLPANQMPEHHSRLHLEITGIQPIRLYTVDFTQQALPQLPENLLYILCPEFPEAIHKWMQECLSATEQHKPQPPEPQSPTEHMLFKRLWDFEHPAHPHTSNPYVWVITVQPTQAPAPEGKA